MKERLQKFLSRAGVASRRAAERAIVDGQVAVNGRVVRELGTLVDPQLDEVRYAGEVVASPGMRRYFLLHKPPGFVTTRRDPQGRPTVMDLLRASDRTVFPVGRLDFDTQGALLLTDDGALAHRLMHPRFHVERGYLAEVEGAPTIDALAKLQAGVWLEDGEARALQAEMVRQDRGRAWIHVVVGEGRTHLVKRMVAAIGHPVVRLYRPAHAGLSVENLEVGQYRSLTVEEIAAVTAVAAGETLVRHAKLLPPPALKAGKKRT